MWVEERHHKILDLLSKKGRVSIEVLAAEIDGSRETIRRDLLRLEKEGLLRRIHGGAVSLEPVVDTPFQNRVTNNADEKRLIAQRAAAFVKPGMTIFIDGGTTMLTFAAELQNVPDITVITNSLEAALLLRSTRMMEVIVLGGRFAIDAPSTSGEILQEQVSRFNADLAVISSVGVDATAGVTYHHLSEAEVARAMVRQSKRTILLADHTKFGLVSRIKACDLSNVDICVTDAATTDVKALKQSFNSQLVVAAE